MSDETLGQLADEALFVQDACNPVAIAHGFSRAVKRLVELEGWDANKIKTHPIYRLWASKIHDIAGLNSDRFTKFFDAYEACEKLRDEKASVE